MSTTPTVLIIEDDPVFRRVLSFTVAKSGLSVETANDGEEGFERLARGGIDFIVTDFQMPRCGGIELLTRLDELPDYTRPPAILCTAKGLELDSEQLRRDFRLACIMHKPFSPRKLSEVILQHLEKSSSSDAAECPKSLNSLAALTSPNQSTGLGALPSQGCGNA